MTFQLGITGCCSVAVSSLLTGANLGFPFSGEKEHSEKAEDTQLNPNHGVLWHFLNLKSHMC